MSTELEKRKDEEYEMQLFGFNSRAVQSTLEHIVEERIQLCCKKLWESLERINKSDENNTLTLRTDGKNLSKVYHSHSQPHTNTMKKCVKKFIAVPRNILLDEDKCQAIQYSEEEFRCMEKHLEDLQSRAKKAKMLHAALEEELKLSEEFERNENVAEILSTVMENLLHPDVDNKLIRCVENCHVFENTIKKSGAITNVYKNSVHNLRVKTLDPNCLQPDLSKGAQYIMSDIQNDGQDTNRIIDE